MVWVTLWMLPQLILLDQLPKLHLLVESKFDNHGNERHLAVKTTQRSRETDEGFFLTANEYQVALQDPNWTVVRVWSIDGSADCEGIGNPVVQLEGTFWRIDPASWKVQQEISPEAS